MIYLHKIFPKIDVFPTNIYSNIYSNINPNANPNANPNVNPNVMPNENRLFDAPRPKVASSVTHLMFASIEKRIVRTFLQIRPPQTKEIINKFAVGARYPT